MGKMGELVSFEKIRNPFFQVESNNPFLKFNFEIFPAGNIIIALLFDNSSVIFLICFSLLFVLYRLIGKSMFCIG